MGASPFQAFAESHDLDYAEKVAPGHSLPQGEVSEVVGGSLPGGIEGLVARLVQPLPEGTFECVLVMTRIPESASFLPYVTCRDTEFKGVMDRLIGPGGLIPLVDHVEFESIELNRRYRIGIFRGSGENRLRQLFAPTVIDWMAHEAPEGIYFELFGGMLSVTIGGAASEESEVERACGLAGRLASVIRSESLEGVGEGGTAVFQVSPEYEEAERERKRKIAAAKFGSPPEDVASAAEALEPVVKGESKGLLRKVFSSINEGEAQALAFEAVMDGYARRHGLTLERPTDFLARHIGLPLPMVAQHSLRGELPGLGVTGDLFVRVAGAEIAPGVAVPWPRGGEAVLQVIPHEEGGGTTNIGGYQVAVLDGERRESEATRANRAAAEAIAGELGRLYNLTGNHLRPGETLSPAMRDWLLADQRVGKCALLLGGGVLVLLDRGARLEDWSVAGLDRFCESLAPILA